MCLLSLLSLYLAADTAGSHSLLLSPAPANGTHFTSVIPRHANMSTCPQYSGTSYTITDTEGLGLIRNPVTNTYVRLTNLQSDI